MADQRHKLHSGEGHLGSNLAIFAVCLVILLAGFYVLNFVTFQTPWPFIACILLVGLAYFIPKQILGRSDSHGE